MGHTKTTLTRFFPILTIYRVTFKEWPPYSTSKRSFFVLFLRFLSVELLKTIGISQNLFESKDSKELQGRYSKGFQKTSKNSKAKNR